VTFANAGGPLAGIYDPNGMGAMLFAVLAVAAQRTATTPERRRSKASSPPPRRVTTVGDPR